MKYVRAFFNFLGFLSFVSMVGAATFFWIGYQRNKAKTSTVTFKDVSMTPAKEETTTTTAADLETIPDIQPISRPAARDRLVDPKPTGKPARKPATKPAKTAAAKPAPVAKPVPVTYTTTEKRTAPAKRQPARKPARKIERQQPAPAPQTDLSPCTLSFKATDRSGNQRTGHGVVNVAETSELEKMAARRVEAIRELEAAGQQLRNPYGN